MYFDEIKLNTEIRLEAAYIDREEMLAFARRYDNVPLHTDEEYAKTTPFGDLIAPGVMAFMAVWAKYLEADLFGEELLAGKSTSIQWHKPVFPGDTLTGIVKVTRLVERNPRNGLVELSIDITNQNGDLVMTNVTEAVVKKFPKV